MITKLTRIKDKVHAMLAILFCKEFALFTCQKFDKSDNAMCILSIGVENKEKSKIFRETIADFIKSF